ncbi:MAG: hypothetical protein COB08_009510 [Rhodobacteraceae bacterium]|nr:hypothetical protein [Paracoccaceae bacterium]
MRRGGGAATLALLTRLRVRCVARLAFAVKRGHERVALYLHIKNVRMGMPQAQVYRRGAGAGLPSGKMVDAPLRCGGLPVGIRWEMQ